MVEVEIKNEVDYWTIVNFGVGLVLVMAALLRIIPVVDLLILAELDSKLKNLSDFELD